MGNDQSTVVRLPRGWPKEVARRSILAVQTFCGSSPLYNRLVPPQAAPSEDTTTNYKVSVEKLVCHSLNMSGGEISREVPLTAYGLNQLSLALRPLLTITQLQLLGDVSIQDIWALFEKNNDHGPGENGKLRGDTISQGPSIDPDSRVDAMHAMVQNIPVDERQRRAFLDHGLHVSMKKVTMMEVDLSVERLLDKFADSITHIIHIGWLVDFNMGLSSYKANIQGLRNLIEFALASQARLVCTRKRIRESKWVSEELLRLAPGLRYLVVRVGQLSGDSNGTWKVNEWFPSVIQSAPFLGCLPNEDNPVSWLPMHVAAQAIVDRIDILSSIIHIVHPKPAQWSKLAQVISKELNVELVPYAQWLKLLEKSALDAATLPAMQLLSYYKRDAEALLVKDTEAFGLPKVSAELVTAADFPQLDDNKVKKWLAYWRRVGMI
ncbi:hypothetical protein EDD85DRAFT_790707 [Armillaria nabsnona]|nr:hypothetical protein EDD85DRAFT_790707 [Armillaria nabsnona]